MYLYKYKKSLGISCGVNSLLLAEVVGMNRLRSTSADVRAYIRQPNHV